VSGSAARRNVVRLPRERRMRDIEAAARDVFSRNGYALASMAEIAEGAGVVEGTIYKYFENKRVLLLTVLQHWYEGMIAEFLDKLSGIEGTEARIHCVIWQHIKSIRENPDLCRLFYAEVRSSEDYFDGQLYRLNRDYTRVLMDIVRGGIARGELREDVSVTLVRDVIFGGIEHHVASYLNRRGDFDPDAVARQLTYLVMAGISRPADAPAMSPASLRAAIERLERVADRIDGAAAGGRSEPMLQLTNVQIMYDRAIEAVRDVSLTVERGQIVALLGSNGAGKSTLLKAISNVLYPEEGEVLHGEIALEGESMLALSADEIVRAGVLQVPEGRRLFPLMTVEENLTMGAFLRTRSQVAAGLEQVYALFPVLKERRGSVAGYLSGGEQQMVAVGRALMGEPRLLMLDEPWLGLAPQIIDQIFKTIVALNRERQLSILLVEQNAALALEVADYGYIMENGRVVLDGPAKQIAGNEDVKEFYLGYAEGGERKTYREVKHYKRRKRWLS